MVTRAMVTTVAIFAAALLPNLAHAGFEADPVQVEAVAPAPERDYAPSLSYPKVARKLGKEADCKLKVSIDKKGRTTLVQALECDSLFAKRTEVGLKQWTWEPWRVDGKKAEHSFEVRVQYSVTEVEDEAEDTDAS